MLAPILQSMSLLGMLSPFFLAAQKMRLQRDLLDTGKFFKLVKELRLNEKKKLADSSFIESTIQVDIPEYPKAYNASIVPVKDRYLLAFRIDRYRLPLAQNLPHFRNYIGLILLDQDFKPIQRSTILNELGSRCYDPRLFLEGEKIFMSYGSAFEGDPDAVSRSRINLVEIRVQDDQFLLKKSVPMKVKDNRKFEKNWSLFSYNNQLFYTYLIQPHKILSVDTRFGYCKEVASSDTPFSWHFGELKGGTPALEREDCYLAFFHSGIWFLGRHFYFMGAYTFSKEPPFEILKISADPFFYHDFYTSERNPNIISNVTFPGGYFVRNGKIYLCYGENDASIKIAVLDEKGLLEGLSPIERKTQLE